MSKDSDLDTTGYILVSFHSKEAADRCVELACERFSNSGTFTRYAKRISTKPTTYGSYIVMLAPAADDVEQHIREIQQFCAGVWYATTH